MERIPFTKILFLVLLIDLVSISSGQNCAVPKIVNVKDDSLTETLDTGQHLATIKVKNVVGVSSLQQVPENFSRAKFDPFTGKLTLEVETPLWRTGQLGKSFIDDEMANCVDVRVELLCEDGRSKRVTFRIEIKDDNTEMPHFEQPEYDLEAEVCLLSKCALIFTKDIVVIDEDRDEENAQMELRVNASLKHCEVKILSTEINLLENHYDSKRLPRHTEIRQFGYEIKVRLEIEITHTDRSDDTDFEFELQAINKKSHADGEEHVARTHVKVRFKEFSDRKLAPVYSSSMYYMCVQEVKKFSFKIFPGGVHASIPGGAVDDSTIEYSIYSDIQVKIIQINKTSGEIEFCDSFNHDQFRKLKSSVVEYVVHAKRVITGNGDDDDVEESKLSSATLIVFFPDCDCASCSDDDDPRFPPDPIMTTEFPTDIPTTEHGGKETTTEFPITNMTFTTTQLPTTVNSTTTQLPTTVNSTTTQLPTTINSTTTVNSTTTQIPTTLNGTATETQLPTTEHGGNRTTTLVPTTEHAGNITTTPLPTTDHGGNRTTTSLPTTDHEGNRTSTNHPTKPPLLPPPTRPPDHCTCDCTQFSCKNSPEPSIITGFSYHADPYYCTKYHQCSKRDDDDYEQSTYNCPLQTIFCPNISECLTVEECLKRTGVDMTSPHLETGKDSEFNLNTQAGFCGNWSCTCFSGIWPGEPENLCNETNYMDLIEDPIHCDIFHQCQPLTEPHNHHFIDYPQRCAKGLVYCHAIRACTYPTDSRCFCNKTFKHCDVYEMGRWENFDIFNKTFISKLNKFTVAYLFSLFH